MSSAASISNGSTISNISSINNMINSLNTTQTDMARVMNMVTNFNSLTMENNTNQLNVNKLYVAIYC